MSYQKSKADHESFLALKKAEILAKKNNKEVVRQPPAGDDTEKKTPKLPFANDGSFLEKFMALQKSNQQQPNIKKQAENIKIESTNEYGADEQCSSSKTTVAALLASKVVLEGDEAENIARVEHSDDHRYRFLFEPSSSVAQFYRKEIKRLKEVATNSTKPLIQSTSSKSSSTLYPAFTSAGSSQQQPATVKTPDPLSEFEKAKMLIRAKAATLLAGKNVPCVYNEEEERKKKEVEEQKLMNNIYAKVIAEQAAAESSSSKKNNKRKSNTGFKYDYDSDEDVDGGTWEHKKRKAEMEKTKEWALDLTSESKGKHHIADFLPPDELEKFLEKVTAVREGRDADFSDYSKYRIQADNLGYKLLQKAGWQEGSGLGSKGEGITQPINKGKVSFDHTGVGSEKPAEIKKNDDDFDLYRKRMMLAYKFRPNPLNNPRRPYYS